MPGVCDLCKYKDKCPYYAPGKQVCDVEQAFLSTVKSLIVDDTSLPLLVKRMLEEKLRRYARARFFEQLAGGDIVKEVSRLENEVADMVEKYLKIQYPERFRTTRVIQAGEEQAQYEDELDKIYKILVKDTGEEEEEDAEEVDMS